MHLCVYVYVRVPIYACTYIHGCVSVLYMQEVSDDEAEGDAALQARAETALNYRY